ncbi:hypothetical protein [Nocardia brasiliensis]|uniref:hypothetical protein n=1 Tax=Nocardia brasiliensis TaxID=37326 RepID=UPI002456FA3E|nr:hypothetical protein [Nocardia brasiliensis]
MSISTTSAENSNVLPGQVEREITYVAYEQWSCHRIDEGIRFRVRCTRIRPSYARYGDWERALRFAPAEADAFFFFKRMATIESGEIVDMSERYDVSDTFFIDAEIIAENKEVGVLVRCRNGGITFLKEGPDGDMIVSSESE